MNCQNPHSVHGSFSFNSNDITTILQDKLSYSYMRILRFCDAISEQMPHVIFLIYHTSKCEYIPHILKHAVTWWQWDGSLQGSYEFDLLFRPQALAVVSIYGTVFVNITYVANNIFPCNLRDGFIYQCSLVNHNENCVLSSVFSLRMSGLQNQTWHLDILYLKGFRIYSVCMVCKYIWWYILVICGG